MAIPKHAKRVYEGIIFDVYQWEQEMFDKTMKTYEGVKRIPSIQILATRGDKIILFDEEQPFIGHFVSMPGGHLERNETPESGARRELLEETGMVPQELKLWKMTNEGVSIEWTSYYFVAKNCEKIQEPHPENSEKIKVKLFGFDEFIKEVQKDNFRNLELQLMILKMLQNKEELEAFKKLLF